MKTQDAIDHFGGIPALAAAIDVTIPAIYQWQEFPPKLRQLQMQAITGGTLKAEPDCMPSEPADTTQGS